ncbi:MAG TPA: DUF5658 family protein [Armatimonadota bacterium]|nr:DUF5658 family protein [Armatimonadota bacterium]
MAGSQVVKTSDTMGQTKRFALAKESYIILVICLLDMALTGWLLHTKRAIEGNPIMSFYLQDGIGMMIAAKLVLIAMPLFIAEWARRYRPRFVHRALRIAIAIYISLYLIAFLNAGILACEYSPALQLLRR